MGTSLYDVYGYPVTHHHKGMELSKKGTRHLTLTVREMSTRVGLEPETLGELEPEKQEKLGER